MPSALHGAASTSSVGSASGGTTAVEGAAIFLNSTDAGKNIFPLVSDNWPGMTFSTAFSVETTTESDATAVTGAEVAKLCWNYALEAIIKILLL
jgi:hypothetical protein